MVCSIRMPVYVYVNYMQLQDRNVKMLKYADDIAVVDLFCSNSNCFAQERGLE